MIYSSFFTILIVGSCIINNLSSNKTTTIAVEEKVNLITAEQKLIAIQDRIISHIKNNNGSFQFISHVQKPYVGSDKYISKGFLDSQNVKNTGQTRSNCLEKELPINSKGQFGEKGSYQRFGDFKWPEIGNNPAIPCGYNAYYSATLPNWLLGPTPFSSYWGTTYEKSGTLFHIRFDRLTHFQDFAFLYYHDEVLTNNLLKEMSEMFKISSELSGISGLANNAFTYQKINNSPINNSDKKGDILKATASQSNPFQGEFEIKFNDEKNGIDVRKNIYDEYSDQIIEKYELENPYSLKRNEFYQKFNSPQYYDNTTREKQKIIKEKIQTAIDELIKKSKNKKQNITNQ